MIRLLLLTSAVLFCSFQTLYGCSSSNCCESCGDNTCCNQCQTRCRTTTCLTQCHQDCCPQSSSCQTSNCCQSTKCYQRSSCQKSACFSSCQSRCTEDIDVCSSQCSKVCCGEKVSTISNCCNTTTISQVSPEVRVIGTIGAESTRSSTNLDTNNNNSINNTVTTLININNTVNNENKIEVPIDISNINRVNVNIVPANDTFSIINSNDGNLVRNIEFQSEPKTVPVPIPVPIPIPAPQETTTGVPTCQPIPSQLPGLPYTCQQNTNQPNCCNMIVPCAQSGCQSLRRTCGSQCTNSFMYLPVNPCQGGCFRRNYAIGNVCSMSGFCRQTFMDCSYCDMNNFYNSYQGYQQCRECFYSNNA